MIRFNMCCIMSEHIRPRVKRLRRCDVINAFDNDGARKCTNRQVNRSSSRQGRKQFKDNSCTKSHEHFADEFGPIFVILFNVCVSLASTFYMEQYGAFASTQPHKRSESQTNNGENLQEVTRTFNVHILCLSLIVYLMFASVYLASTSDLEQYLGHTRG